MKDKTNGPLPRQGIKFLRALIDRGVYPGFFETLTYDLPRTNLQLALTLGALSRINPRAEGIISEYARPILLGWDLPGVKSAHHDLRINEQHNALNRYPGEADMLDQLQPTLPVTRANVFELRRPYDAAKFLQEFTGYAMKENSRTWVEDYISEHQIAFGLAHAKQIIKELAQEQYRWVHDVMPMIGPGSLGRNLFVLVADQSFTDMRDKAGAPSFGWYQVTVIDDVLRPKHLHVTFHRNLHVLIPKGSFIALANVQWIRRPGPHSD